MTDNPSIQHIHIELPTGKIVNLHAIAMAEMEETKLTINWVSNQPPTYFERDEATHLYSVILNKSIRHPKRLPRLS